MKIEIKYDLREFEYLHGSEVKGQFTHGDLGYTVYVAVTDQDVDGIEVRFMEDDNGVEFNEAMCKRFEDQIRGAVSEELALAYDGQWDTMQDFPRRGSLRAQEAFVRKHNIEYDFGF